MRGSCGVFDGYSRPDTAIVIGDSLAQSEKEVCIESFRKPF
jgi:hypothetical protein